jgi:L-ascorbate metabolism protein UlaG (beta-lactamase superfamily)
MLDDISDIDAVILPINGRGNNMNAADAEKFASDVDAKLAIPMHFGMLDELTPDIFNCKNKYIPEIYREFEL